MRFTICLNELTFSNGMMSSYCAEANCLQCEYKTDDDYKKCHYFFLKKDKYFDINNYIALFIY